MIERKVSVVFDMPGLIEYLKTPSTMKNRVSILKDENIDENALFLVGCTLNRKFSK